MRLHEVEFHLRQLFPDEPDLPDELWDLIGDYYTWFELGKHMNACILEHEAGLCREIHAMPQFHHCAIIWWVKWDRASAGGNTFYCSKCGEPNQTFEPQLMPDRMFCPGCPLWWVE